MKPAIDNARAVLATAHSPSSTEGRETLPCITGCGSAAMMPDSEYCSECAASHRPSEASTAKTTVLPDFDLLWADAPHEILRNASAYTCARWGWDAATLPQKDPND
jgi:hypothetical protein